MRSRRCSFHKRPESAPARRRPPSFSNDSEPAVTNPPLASHGYRRVLSIRGAAHARGPAAEPPNDSRPPTSPCHHAPPISCERIVYTTLRIYNYDRRNLASVGAV